MENNPLKSIFELIEGPTDTKPWMELKCKSNEDTFSKEVVDVLANIPLLMESDSPIFFRGQSDCRWTLEPKLYRLWSGLIKRYGQKQKDILKNALYREYDSIMYFQRRSYKHLEIAGTIPRKLSDNTIGEWLALMQHYSTPTRLLDWTTSFYVALYFAAQDDSTNGAVWYFDKYELENVTSLYKEITPEQADKIFEDRDKFAEFGLTVNPMDYIFENHIKTDRIISQGSVFTLSTYLFTDQAYSLGSSLRRGKEHPFLWKIVIPKNIKKDVRKRLAKINITNETLFACIDSIGKTIHEKVQLYQDEILIPKLQNNEPI